MHSVFSSKAPYSRMNAYTTRIKTNEDHANRMYKLPPRDKQRDGAVLAALQFMNVYHPYAA
jgi:hypothetical protein